MSEDAENDGTSSVQTENDHDGLAHTDNIPPTSESDGHVDEEDDVANPLFNIDELDIPASAHADMTNMDSGPEPQVFYNIFLFIIELLKHLVSKSCAYQDCTRVGWEFWPYG